MKRIVCSLLVLLLLGSFMASCGGKETVPASEKENTVTAESQSTNNSDTASAENTITDGLPDTDMEGFKFTILHYNQNQIPHIEHRMKAESENGDIVDDAIYKRNLAIEERFNAKLNIIEVDKPGEVMAAAVLAGEDVYDIVLQSGKEIVANIPYLADFNNLDFIDIDAPYWNPEASNMFLIGGKQIAAAGNFTLAYLSGTSCFMFNKDMYNDLGIKENFYQLVLDGNWTTDKFYSIGRLAITDIDGDGNMGKNDRFGIIASNAKVYLGSLITGAGFKYVNHNEKGYPEFTMPKDEKMISFVLKLIESRINEPYLYYTESTSYASVDNNILFENGTGLFLCQFVKRIQDYRGMEIEFGILPSPKYDETQEKYYSRAAIGEAATLPKTVDPSRYENIGILLEALTFHSQNNLVQEYKEVMLKTKLARDDDSSAMLDYVFENVVFDIGMVVASANMDNIIGNMYFKGENTLTSSIASMESAANATIESIIESVDNSMK